MRTIKVCTSRNSSKLLLRKTFNMTPMKVYEILSKLITFTNLIGHELSPGYFEYQIIFKCNEEAVHARREILKSISKFGGKAIIMWDASCRGNTPRKGSYAPRQINSPTQQNRNRCEMNALQAVPAYNSCQNFYSLNALLNE